MRFKFPLSADSVKVSLRFVILSEAKNPRLYGNKGFAFVIYYMSCAEIG